MRIVQAGQNIGPYRVMEKVGEGGMAAVYRAYHASMDRDVALKIMPFQFAQNEEFNQRFQREVRVIAGLEHPHILPVYDSGEFEGSPYLVMRYLNAGTLYGRIKAGALPLEQVDWIFSQVADALGYAHSRDVIHRDVKPSNVLIDGRGDAFLMDFGIAKLVGDSSKFTATGVITGTPAYMSPEQAHTQDLDGRSDVYALGVVLYEMVTGRVPFEAETPMAVILKHIQEPLPLPSELNPDLHPAVERVILKALAKNREDRFGSMDEFLAAWKQAYSATTGVTGTGSQRPLRAAPATAVLSRNDATQVRPTARPVDKPKRKLPMGLLVGGVIGVVALLVLVAGGLMLSRLGNDDGGSGGLAGRSDDGETESIFEDLTGGGVDGSGLVGGISGEGSWQTWYGANRVNNLSSDGQTVYAGGPSGLTLWNSLDGSYEHWTIADGLPDNSVNDTFTDGDGVLWVATNNGLGRYDGGSWTIYDAQDGIHPYVSAIAAGDQGVIVATSYGPADSSGVYEFTEAGWQELPPHSSADDNLHSFKTALAYIPGYGLWLGTPNGLGWYNEGAWQWFTEEDGLPHNFVNSLYVDENAHLWITTDGGVVLDDQGPEVTVFEQTRGWSVWDVTQDDEGRYWFAGGGGAWLFNRAQADWQFFSSENGDFPVYNTTSVTRGGDGHMYLGTEGVGVLHYDGAFTVDAVPNVPRQGISIWAMATPGEQLWFVEQYTDGIDRFNPETEQWSVGPELPCCGTPIMFDEGGRLWMGGYTGVTILAEDGTSVRLTTEEGLPTDDGIFAMAFGRDGAAWIGTDAGLVKIVDGAVAEVFTQESVGLLADDVDTVFVAGDDSVWVGMDEGLSRLGADGVWENFTYGSPFGDGFYVVRGMVEAPAGTIWVGTNHGLYRYVAGSWAFLGMPEGTLATSVNTIAVDSVGNVWVGTPAGVSAFDGQEWFNFTTADGLAHPFINAIVPTSDGVVWLATDGGVSRYTP